MIKRFILFLVSFFTSFSVLAAFAPNPGAFGLTIAELTQARLVAGGLTQAAMASQARAAIGAAILARIPSAAVVTAVGVTAPAWLTAAATFGAVVGVGTVAYGLYKNWKDNGNGTVTQTPEQPPLTGGNQGTDSYTPNRPVTMDSVVAKGCLISSSDAAPYTYTIARCATEKAVAPGVDIAPSPMGSPWPPFSKEQFYSTGGRTFVIWSTSPSVRTTNQRCMNGYFIAPDGDCKFGVQPVTQTYTQLKDSLTDAEKETPLDSTWTGEAVGKIWAEAIKTNPELAPSLQTPPTPAEIVAVKTKLGTGWPRVGDIVEPQIDTRVPPVPSTGPWSIPEPTGTVTPPVPPASTPGGSTGPVLDWSVQPTSETLPVKSFTASYAPVPFLAATGCPAPVKLTFFGNTHDISYAPMCDLMTTLAPIFLTLGAISAALIFMAGFRVT